MIADNSPEFPEIPENEQTVCFCHNVPRGQIIEAIRQGARTLYEIQAGTCASTGCGGCECEVLEILESEAGKSGGQRPAGP